MEIALAIFVFAFVSTLTPGPNNLMVLVSGANWGYRRTIPHMLGITVGFPGMVLAVGLGLGVLFERFPQAHQIIWFIAVGYLLYLAWRIGSAGFTDPNDAPAPPLSFREAAAFQWVNPKAWAMALGSVPLFTTPEGNPLFEVTRIALIFALVCFPGVSAWCLFGRAIAGFLADPWRRRWFNAAMAVLLVVSVAPTLW